MSPTAPTLTSPSQQARRERILMAALELAAEGGWDAVQMRTVAERADVALGTLYRYFPSKVHLLVCAMARQLVVIRNGISQRDLAGDDPEQRVLAVLSRVTTVLGRNRQLSGALVRALMTADGAVAAEAAGTQTTMTSIIASATRGPGEAPTDRDELVAAIIGKVWFSDIQAWLSDRMTLADVLRSLNQTVEAVLPAAR